MDTEKRVYEFSYLLVPSMAEEAVNGKIEELKKLFASNGAEFISEESPEYIGLAYTMIHQVNNKNERINSAYFGWLKMNAGVDILEQVKMTLDRDTDLVRYMLIKTVAENTLAPKKLSQKPSTRKRISSETISAEEVVLPESELELPSQIEPTIDSADEQVVAEIPIEE